MSRYRCNAVVENLLVVEMLTMRGTISSTTCIPTGTTPAAVSTVYHNRGCSR